MRIFSESWNDEQQVRGGKKETLDGKGNTPHSYWHFLTATLRGKKKKQRNLEIPTLPIYQISSKVVA